MTRLTAPDPASRLQLHGEYPVAIDDKNRLLIPQAARASLPTGASNAWIICPGPGAQSPRRAWLMPECKYAELLSRLANPQDVETLHAIAERVRPDKAGRVTIPEHVLRRCLLQRSVTVVGKGLRLEIWNRDDYEAELESSLARVADVEALDRFPRPTANRRRIS